MDKALLIQVLYYPMNSLESTSPSARILRLMKMASLTLGNCSKWLN
jgi:hypothetical protein